jgi:hypothetical protein
MLRDNAATCSAPKNSLFRAEQGVHHKIMKQHMKNGHLLPKPAAAQGNPEISKISSFQGTINLMRNSAPLPKPSKEGS